jgi:hypothetical protein
MNTFAISSRCMQVPSLRVYLEPASWLHLNVGNRSAGWQRLIGKTRECVERVFMASVSCDRTYRYYIQFKN